MGGARLVAHRSQEIIVIAENAEDRLVDDGNVGELEMGVQRLVWRDGGLDHGGEPHRRIVAAGLARRPAGGGKRRELGSRRRSAPPFRQQQAGGIHVGARDMRMDVDRARHDDHAARIVNGVGARAGRGRLNNPVVVNPDIADSVAALRGIDDAAAPDACQHDAAPASSPSATTSLPITSATDGVWLGCEAAFETNVPIATQ